MKNFRLIILLLLLVCFNNVSAQTMTKESFVQTSSTINYWLYTPDSAKANLPLLIYLHGGSGKGNDLDNLLISGFPKNVYDGEFENLNAYVIIPQLASNIVGWSDISTSLRDLITQTCSKYNCDKTKISITGHSMGGTGTWAIAAAYPKLFYRIAPLSGSVKLTEKNLTALKDSYIWAFVGSEDEIVAPESSIEFVDSLHNSLSECTIIEGASHFDVPQVYLSNDYNLVDWLLGKDKITAIKDVQTSCKETSGIYYDLSGRKVMEPKHGIYIFNKRKVVIE